jgi:hypothetical protein
MADLEQLDVDAPEVADSAPEAPSMRDEMAATFRELQAKEADAAPADDTPAADGRERDESGRFKAKDAAPVEVAAEPVAEPVQDAPPEPTAEVPPAPASWRAEAKAKWAELPAEVRSEVERRETEVRQLAGRMDSERQAGRVFSEVINPYLPIIRQQNIDPARLITDLLQTSYVLNTADPAKKAQTLAMIADQYGIDMDAAYQYRGQHQALPAHDPAQQQIAAVPDVATQVEQVLLQREVAREVEEFRANPANKYIDEVEPYMQALLQSGLANSLQDAYNQAMYARPDLRSTLLAAERATWEAQQAAERAKRAQQARLAAVSPSGTTGSPRPAAPTETSLRDELRQGIRAIVGRA